MGIIIGIDPGVTGAVAAVRSGGQFDWLLDIPVRDAGKQTRSANEIDGAVLAGLLRLHLAEIIFAVVEEVQPMGGSRKPGGDDGGARHGALASFGLGDSRGCIRGVCEALHIRVVRVHPMTWKTHFGLRGVKGDTDAQRKERSRAAAIRMYPGAADLLGRKKDHNRGEALLLARYGAQLIASGNDPGFEFRVVTLPPVLRPVSLDQVPA